jgi:DNA-binding GntR family transcriptional regulator
MQEHGLARGTVRKAIDTLVDEGLVNRVQGRGTFVVPADQLPKGRP